MDKESIKNCLPISKSPLYDIRFIEKIKKLPKLKKKEK